VKKHALLPLLAATAITCRWQRTPRGRLGDGNKHLPAYMSDALLAQAKKAERTPDGSRG